MKPRSLKIRMYQVGFGDCFLLTFTYASGNKHVLIDCGSNKQHGYDIEEIAKHVKATCKQEPVAVVITHRHLDHIAGFGGDAWKHLKDLNVKRVLQPWTEDPELETDAMAPPSDDPGVAAVASLANLQAIAQAIHALAEQMPPSTLRSALLGIGENNVKNPEIVKNLQTWKDRTDYVQAGFDGALETFLPGVKVHVLGPPTRAQAAFNYASESAEYWPLVGATEIGPQNPKGGPVLAAYTGAPINAKWIKERLDTLRERRWFEIVTAVDKALNNTSLILVFEIEDEYLLFPGDAQVENWRYALAQDGVEDLLAKVTWYKVGHHGSHNATPKSMWKALAKRQDGLSTLLSTHHHGSYPQIPRPKLVAALESDSTVYSTELFEDAIFVDIDALDFTG